MAQSPCAFPTDSGTDTGEVREEMRQPLEAQGIVVERLPMTHLEVLTEQRDADHAVVRIENHQDLAFDGREGDGRAGYCLRTSKSDAWQTPEEGRDVLKSTSSGNSGVEPPAEALLVDSPKTGHRDYAAAFVDELQNVALDLL